MNEQLEIFLRIVIIIAMFYSIYKIVKGDIKKIRKIGDDLYNANRTIKNLQSKYNGQTRKLKRIILNQDFHLESKNISLKEYNSFITKLYNEGRITKQEIMDNIRSKRGVDEQLKLKRDDEK